MRTALGFRAHSGWAAAVAVAGTVDAPRILERRHIIIADPEMPGSKQPYHAAAELPFSKAEALVRRATESSRGLALEAVSAILNTLRSKGHEVAGCGESCAIPARTLPALERILAAHPLIHTAEGEMFRDVLAWAAEECGLRVTPTCAGKGTRRVLAAASGLSQQTDRTAVDPGSKVRHPCRPAVAANFTIVQVTGPRICKSWWCDTFPGFNSVVGNLG